MAKRTIKDAKIVFYKKEPEDYISLTNIAKINMKHICIIFCLLFPFIGFCQTEKEAKTMLTKRNYSFTVDSSIQKIIVENTWKRIYYYDIKSFRKKMHTINSNQTLRFEGEIFFDEPYFSGTYFFNKNFLYTDIDEMGAYKIINFINNEYLVVERYIPMGRNGKYKSSHRRTLFQIQSKIKVKKL